MHSLAGLELEEKFLLTIYQLEEEVLEEMMIGVNRVMAEEHCCSSTGAGCDICCVLLCDERYPTFPGTFCSREGTSPALYVAAKAIEVQ